MLEETHIAVIEENPADARWFELILKDIGFAPNLEIYQVASRAIAKFKSTPAPDLIISRWYLPDMEFVDALHEIRSIPGFERTPIAVFASDDRIREGASILDVIGRISKPAVEAEVRDLIRKLWG